MTGRPSPSTARRCAMPSTGTSPGRPNPTSASPPSSSTARRRPRHPDHHPPQRPPELPPRRPDLPRRAHRHRKEARQDLRRTRPRITSHAPDSADARRLLELNRGHWKVESVQHILDNAFDEDRLRIRTGHCPVNTTHLRHFAISVIRSHTEDCIASAMRTRDDCERQAGMLCGKQCAPRSPHAVATWVLAGGCGMSRIGRG